MFERSKNFSLTVREFIEKTHGKDADNFLHPEKKSGNTSIKGSCAVFQTLCRSTYACHDHWRL